MSKEYDVVYLDVNTGNKIILDKPVNSPFKQFRYVQSAPASIWTMVHNQYMNTFVTVFYDQDGNEMLPSKFYMHDSLTAVAEFNVALSGQALLFFFEGPIIGLTPTPSPTPSQNTSSTTTSTPTPTPTPTASLTFTSTATPTPTPSVTFTSTPTVTPSISITPSTSSVPLVTPTPSVTLTPNYLPSHLFRLNSDGSLDTTFTDLGLNNIVYKTAQNNDGNIYVVGAFTASGAQTYNYIIRLNSNGVLDTSYNNFTILPSNNFVDQVYKDSTGNLYMDSSITSINGNPYITIFRLTSNGSLDTTFPNYGWTTSNYFEGFLQLSNGSIYLSGNFTSVDGHAYTNIVRLNSDGTVDTTFTDLSPDNDVYSLLQTIDGKIYVAGTFTSIGGQSYTRFARLNSDGTLDTTFTAITSNNPIDTMIQAIDGKIYVGGAFTSIGGQTYDRLARLNSDGTLDTTFTNININGAVNSIIQTADGAIYFAGTFNTVVGLPDATSVARLTSIGVLDTSYTGPTYGRFFNTVYNLEQTADGKIYVSTL